ncbi:uncharacterized protein LOC129290472 isoform X1 [Prosopis cineraria]|uniref:uncharacterized protein LOC129290472 isoform X1 n=1 Tax=Prosopis cineraria TaxID=364024 RepID=UPI002410B336|nr:uncharacterized protein LOC129290472 isoform X1 [Prosopis cineraria]
MLRVHVSSSPSCFTAFTVGNLCLTRSSVLHPHRQLFFFFPALLCLCDGFPSSCFKLLLHSWVWLWLWGHRKSSFHASRHHHHLPCFVSQIAQLSQSSNLFVHYRRCWSPVCSSLHVVPIR